MLVINHPPKPTDADEAEYRRLVERLAADADAEFADVCGVLAAAGKSADELTRDIAAHQRESGV